MESPKLSILIATVTERKKEFEALEKRFYELTSGYEVEIVGVCDNKEMSIGTKRNLLLNLAKGDYIVFFDDDDWPYDNYISEIMKALENSPDCVGFLIHMTTNGKRPQTCCHSWKYKTWADRVDGYDYVRSVTHFNPVKRELALQVRFPDLRFGEDKDYSDRLTPLCKTEVFINERLFHYRYTNHQNHKQKYG